MIKDILAHLSKADRRTLMTAFNNCDTCIIRLDDRFIGVNVINSDRFKITEAQGVWVLGVYL